MGGTDLSATSGLTHSGPLGSLGLATGPGLDTGLGEPSHDDRSADSVSGGDTAGGLSTEVSAADLVYRKVDAFHRESFCGYVYNLETATGYYVAQGVVASNCRCTIAIQQVDPALFPDLGLV
tara:strand:- start:137 stop:502 length:366 start_codon:yes stop_codon:yes gene_type:complete